MLNLLLNFLHVKFFLFLHYAHNVYSGNNLHHYLSQFFEHFLVLKLNYYAVNLYTIFPRPHPILEIPFLSHRYLYSHPLHPVPPQLLLDAIKYEYFPSCEGNPPVYYLDLRKIMLDPFRHPIFSTLEISRPDSQR